MAAEHVAPKAAGVAIVTTGDARALPFPDESVDLIVTSPPYFGLRSYTDGGEHYASQIGAEATPREFVDALVACTREAARVLKPSGSIFVNLGDKYGPDKGLRLLPERYRIACVDDLGLIARAVIIWSKPNGFPESVRDRVRRSHEDWVHLTKSPRYFEAVDEIRELVDARGAATEGQARVARGSGRTSPAGGNRTGASHAGVGSNPLGKLPGSVWPISTQPLRVPPELNVDHFAAFPMEWPRRLITGWCPPGGVVLDPFGGTGTTALVADVLGRVGISLDASTDYGRIAQWRVADQKQRERAARSAA